VADSRDRICRYYLLRIWEVERDSRLLVPIGLVAGFAYAAKYTAAVILVYALGFVLWKSRSKRAVLVISGCALVMMLPWMLKNWLWVATRCAIANALFPNPYLTPGFERYYAESLRHYNLSSYWNLARGGDPARAAWGVLGPIFLLTPMALVALRSRQGRVLLGAAAVVDSLSRNIGTRFLIPPLPFLALPWDWSSASGAWSRRPLRFSTWRSPGPASRRFTRAPAPGCSAKSLWREALRLTPEEE